MFMAYIIPEEWSDVKKKGQKTELLVWVQASAW